MISLGKPGSRTMLVLEGGWCRSQDIVGQMDFGFGGGGDEHPEGKVDIAGDKAVEMDCGLVWRSRWKQYWSAFGHGKLCPGAPLIWFSGTLAACFWGVAHDHILCHVDAPFDLLQEPVLASAERPMAQSDHTRLESPSPPQSTIESEERAKFGHTPLLHAMPSSIKIQNAKFRISFDLRIFISNLPPSLP